MATNSPVPTSDEFEVVDCPICERDNSEVVTSEGQHGLPTHVVICRTCGLVYLSPRWTRQRYDSFYKNEYESYYRAQSKPRDVEDQKALTFIRQLDAHDPGKCYTNVLDVGCGYGGILSALLNRGHGLTQCAAIEPSTQCQAALSLDPRISLIGDSLEDDWPTTEDGFELIVLRHVLEHLGDPVSCLSKIADRLSDDGILYLAVPDMMHAKGSLEKYWFRVVHTYYFSQETLTHVCRLAGLSVVSMHSENHEIWSLLRVSKPCESERPEMYDTQSRYLNEYKVDGLFRRLISRFAKRIFKR